MLPHVPQLGESIGKTDKELTTAQDFQRKAQFYLDFVEAENSTEQEVNAFVSQAFEHRTFFTRLHQVVLSSDAFIVAPAGIATVLEMMMIWQLLQVRHLQDTPLILVGKMWPGLIEWARSSMLSFDPPLANPEHMTIPRCAANADEAIAIIRQHPRKWLNPQKP